MTARYMNIARELTMELRVMQQSGQKRLPSEEELCRRFACSRQTIRAALAVLEEKGMIVRRQGSGTYIAETASAGSRDIVLMVPDRDEYIYPAIIRDIKTALSAKGYNLCCLSIGGSVAVEREQLSALLARTPAGMIIEAVSDVLPCFNRDLLSRMEEAGVPVVYLHSSYPVPAESPCISQDNYGGAYKIVSHLASKGHRRIAAIMRWDCRQGIERYHGVVQACMDMELELADECCMWLPACDLRDLAENRGVLRRFIREYLNGCTAVVCFSDEIAFNLIKELTAEGIEVPGRIAVTGFDNSYFARTGEIGITSVGTDNHTVGKAAAAAMLNLVTGRKCTQTKLPVDVTVRGSTM